MKKIVKFFPLVIALTAIADTQMEVLKGIGLNSATINWIKLVGLIISVFLPSINSLLKNETMPGTRNTDPQNPIKPKKPR
jgi:hypothetical protein